MDIFVSLAPDSATEFPASQNELRAHMVVGVSIVEMTEGVVMVMGLQLNYRICTS